MMTKLILLFLVAAATPAFAQVKADAPPSRFDAADANHDGKIDRNEYGGFVQELVLLYDGNGDGDGKLSRAELKSAPDPSKFDKIDSDKDGYLTIEEIDVFTDSDFAAMDTNADGAVDRAESAKHK
ncbi:EF-hand domain-containing protein [Lysobacter sp. TAF61]